MQYSGGKNGAGTYQQIINQIPPHRVYVEPFLGSGAIALKKKPAPASIVLDVYAGSIFSFPKFPGCIVINGCGISFLESYDWVGDEFVYCDPPYLGSVRRSDHNIYKHEMKDEETHIRLLNVLCSLPCNVMVSGYWSELYSSMLHRWRTHSFQAVVRSGAMATEWLWMNYPAPEFLHDYAYLGTDFTDRQRIKRRTERWVKRLQKLPSLEREAILQGIRDERMIT